MSFRLAFSVAGVVLAALFNRIGQFGCLCLKIRFDPLLIGLIPGDLVQDLRC